VNGDTSLDFTFFCGGEDPVSESETAVVLAEDCNSADNCANACGFEGRSGVENSGHEPQDKENK
jgi:hypothetical protein